MSNRTAVQIPFRTEQTEIGGSAHDPFYLKTRNVDLYGEMDSPYKNEERELCGDALKVDIVAPGDNLPVPGQSQDLLFLHT